MADATQVAAPCTTTAMITNFGVKKFKKYFVKKENTDELSIQVVQLLFDGYACIRVLKWGIYKKL